MQQVTADDEWCAEAYMETDYSTLTRDDFEKAVKAYAVYRLVGLMTTPEPEDGDEEGANAEDQ